MQHHDAAVPVRRRADGNVSLPPFGNVSLPTFGKVSPSRGRQGQPP